MTKKTTYHHGNLKSELLFHAEELLREKGIAGLSLREVAKMAGVSHNAPYRHFKGKIDLLDALAEVGYLRLRDTALAVIRKYDDPREQLLEAGVGYVQLGVDNPQITNLMFGRLKEQVTPSESLLKARTESFATLITIMGNGIEAKLYSHDDAFELAVTAWSLMHGLTTLAMNDQLQHPDVKTPAPTEVIKPMIELMLQGMLAGNKPSSTPSFLEKV